MSASGKHKDERSNGDPRSPEEITMDHFFQLVMMHQKTKEEWQAEHQPDDEQQERLARQRKALLEQKTSNKKSNE